MRNLLVLCPGEGAHSSTQDVSGLRESSAWNSVERAVESLNVSESESLETFLHFSTGSHCAPCSPVVTTVVNILNLERWRDAGFFLPDGDSPVLVIGHSIGEVAAVYAAGLYSVADAIHCAYALGSVAAQLGGRMLHTRLRPADLENFSGKHGDLVVAAINTIEIDGRGEGRRSTDVAATLCGSIPSVTEWLAGDKGAKLLQPQHPWHHPRYRLAAASATFPGASSSTNWFARLTTTSKTDMTLISPTRNSVLESKDIDDALWRQWLVTPGTAAATRLSLSLALSRSFSLFLALSRSFSLSLALSRSFSLSLALSRSRLLSLALARSRRLLYRSRRSLSLPPTHTYLSLFLFLLPPLSDS